MIDKLLPGQNLGPVLRTDLLSRPQQLPGAKEEKGQSFRALLDESLRSSGGTKFSVHALKRMESRGIGIDIEEMGKLEAAVDRAAAKGSRDSLVLGGEYALVVNLPSRTVVTVLDRAALQEQVVTSIDSAVFV